MDNDEVVQLRKAFLALARSVIQTQASVILLAGEHRGKDSYFEVCSQIEVASRSLNEALRALEITPEKVQRN